MKSRTVVWCPAHIVGIILLAAGCAAFFIHPYLTIGLLLFYIVLCVSACFFPESNFLGEVVSRGRTGKNVVALTFDDGPSRVTTPKILDLLDRHDVKATFFVTGVNAMQYPDLIHEIIRRGHSIGNHSMNHDPFIMMKGWRKLYDEVFEAKQVLQNMGIDVRVFRPPVGIINPKLPTILAQLGFVCVTFNRRACDAGNLRVKNLAMKILKRVQGDDIILLHDKPPRRPEDQAVLWREIEIILTGIRDRGLRIVSLSELIGEQVMSIDPEIQASSGKD